METYDCTLMPRFSQILAQRETELRALLRATAEQPHEADGTGQHRVMDFKDVAMEQALATVDEAKAGHAVHELEEVLAARRRLADQSFGHCLDCGEAIDLRRLAARPAAALCTTCQAIHEHERPMAMRR
ncbi:MAG: TraR/DksA C4-type zinc finger protein [Polaromonas sp.]|uniref:TraR/DksA family transcriptional regulator n=1 Tax=Polaromonas sp. TaxID=1869339 RepID=UPI002731DF16|nr:TraR/DksA C4-type zinc finger protein [Polaromonas sp.]MDP2452331.1 TraR/DksA C4-type zinc finger protein [Polaromonas sp.]MDP3248988.1 TraR/DksA C4-type zinc finger protein [Polaromonas sp.]MDP3754138.1 TraR/DksA C4-type zinc finger protein [Polaromonas sp.]MDP3827697.1 TraR/DksA C4-type zinc finger protein [Polaromonas sp.]